MADKRYGQYNQVLLCRNKQHMIEKKHTQHKHKHKQKPHEKHKQQKPHMIKKKGGKTIPLLENVKNVSFLINKLTKLGDPIAISKSETGNHSLTH